MRPPLRAAAAVDELYAALLQAGESVPRLRGLLEAEPEETTMIALLRRAVPVRFLEAAFYEYPRGFVAAWGKGLRLFSPEALLGNAFKLRPQSAGFFTDWHGLGTPKVEAALEPAG